jgi:beta-lactamase regulating signal transducer with metallopeptidase domain
MARRLVVAQMGRLSDSNSRDAAELNGLVRTLAGRLGLKRCPSVWLVPGALAPMLWTVGRAPRLLLPTRLLERLDREQLQTLLVHELAHLWRRDHWVRFVELAALGLYWWHPVLWWARRELHEAEEQCCDAWVVWALAGAGRCAGG